MLLPSTYFDVIRNVRPFVISFARKDCESLLSLPKPPESIFSVDDYHSTFAECIETLDQNLFGEMARRSGLTFDEIRSILGEKPETQAQYAAVYTTVEKEFHTLVNFELANRKVFHFSDNLVEHLAHTEINVKSDLVRLPFATCLFVLTSKVAIDALYAIHGARGGISPDYSAPISVFLTSCTPDSKRSGSRLVLSAWHAKAPSSCFLMQARSLFLGDNWTLEQSLKTDWESLEPDEIGSGMTIDVNGSSVAKVDDKSFYTDGLLFYRIVLNAVLYLSSEQAEVAKQANPRNAMEEKARAKKNPAKKSSAFQVAGKYSSLDYHEVGGSVGQIVIDKDHAAGTNSGQMGNKPSVRFMVRGHWRRKPQPVEMGSPVLIWVRPYFKGPEIAALINKPYLAK